MQFNSHSNLQGLHAFLGASKYHWINDSEEKLDERYKRYLAVEEGVKKHEFAAMCIAMGEKLQGSKKTLNMYVNDAIGYRMTPEQPLYFSDNCFGTADAISFRKNFLRIHDLKTGVIPAHFEQLQVYAALFCLEYEHKPDSIGMELRIYQNDAIAVHIPDPKDIESIMEKIIIFDKRINRINMGE